MKLKGQVIYVWEKGTTQVSGSLSHSGQVIHRVCGDIGLGSLRKVYFELPSGRRHNICMGCRKFILDSEMHCFSSSNEEVRA